MEESKQHSTPSSIADLDPKKFVQFAKSEKGFASLEDVEELPYAQRIPIQPLESGFIWQVTKFLSPEQCETIIEAAEQTGFEDLGTRSRLLSFEPNPALIPYLQTRLQQADAVLQRLTTQKWQRPVGFMADAQEWDTDTCYLNPCIRIMKYDSKKEDHFAWHRDAPFTSELDAQHQVPLHRSAYTMLIYLTDIRKTGGGISFLRPDADMKHAGLSVEEELKKNKKHKINFFPETGTAILFPQHLLHQASPPSQHCKYVLRTDIVAIAKPGFTRPITALETRLLSLARALFRQAQIMELASNGRKENDKIIDELYARALSLRQAPHRISKYPKRLKKLLKRAPLKMNCPSTPLAPATVPRLLVNARYGNEYYFDRKQTATPQWWKDVQLGCATALWFSDNIIKEEAHMEKFDTFLQQFGFESADIAFPDSFCDVMDRGNVVRLVDWLRLPNEKAMQTTRFSLSKEFSDCYEDLFTNVVKRDGNLDVFHDDSYPKNKFKHLDALEAALLMRAMKAWEQTQLSEEVEFRLVDWVGDHEISQREDFLGPVSPELVEAAWNIIPLAPDLEEMLEERECKYGEFLDGSQWWWYVIDYDPMEAASEVFAEYFGEENWDPRECEEDVSSYGRSIPTVIEANRKCGLPRPALLYKPDGKVPKSRCFLEEEKEGKNVETLIPSGMGLVVPVGCEQWDVCVCNCSLGEGPRDAEVYYPGNAATPEKLRKYDDCAPVVSKGVSMRLGAVETKGSTMTGTVVSQWPMTSYNHASCQCSPMLENRWPCNVYVAVDVKFKFTITPKELIIEYEPFIAM